MTTTTTLAAPTTRRAIRQPGTRTPVWRIGAVAGISASVATVAFAALVRGTAVPLKVGGASIPLLGFAQVTFVAAIIGTALAVVMSRRATRPRHTFLITTAALMLLSFVPDVTADAQTATKVALALSHVVAASIVIPALASRLTD